MPEKTKKPENRPSSPPLSKEKLRALAELVLREGAAGEVRSAVTIGRLILARLFGGSEERFRSKDPFKTDSLNDLAAQDGMADAGWSRERLRDAVELALLAKAHRDLRAWRFLRPSHYEQVVGLPPAKQKELLDRADAEKWTVARLAQEAATRKPARKAAASPAATPERALRRVSKAMAELATFTEPETALAPFLVESGVAAADAAEFTAAVEKALGLLEGFRERLEDLKKGSAARLKRVAGKLTGPA